MQTQGHALPRRGGGRGGTSTGSQVSLVAGVRTSTVFAVVALLLGRARSSDSIRLILPQLDVTRLDMTWLDVT